MSIDLTTSHIKDVIRRGQWNEESSKWQRLAASELCTMLDLARNALNKRTKERDEARHVARRLYRKLQETEQERDEARTLWVGHVPAKEQWIRT